MIHDHVHVHPSRDLFDLSAWMDVGASDFPRKPVCMAPGYARNAKWGGSLHDPKMSIDYRGCDPVSAALFKEMMRRLKLHSAAYEAVRGHLYAQGYRIW